MAIWDAPGTEVSMPRRLMSREARAQVLALRRREGLSFPELAKRTGIRVSTLRVWAQRARRRSTPARPTRFVERDVRPAAVLEGFGIGLAGGRVVRVRSGFDAEELRRLLRTLELPC